MALQVKSIKINPDTWEALQRIAKEKNRSTNDYVVSVLRNDVEEKIPNKPMIKQIWKFPLPIRNNIPVGMPKGASILSIQSQKDTPCIWAVVDPLAEKEERVFSIFGTGNDMEEVEYGEKRVYIGTFQCMDGEFVGHLFEIFNQ